MILLLVLVLLSLVPVGADPPLPGDFNQDQQLDQADLQLLRAALGSADSRYDLNGDSRVDLGDFFRWVDEVEAAPEAMPAPDSAAVISPSSPDEGAAVPDTALPLQPVLPADTTISVPVLPPDSTPSVLPASADSTALPPAAPPLDSTLFVPPLPQDGGLVLPDTTRPFQPVSPAYYAVSTTHQTTTVWLTGYTIVLHNTKPFGIASLRLKGQPVDFVHPSLPIGDWEWFWFGDPAQPEGRAKIKLLEQTWQPPEVERSEEGGVLRFRRQNVLRRGVEVEMACHLDARRPEFTVEYTIRNHSGQLLISPYMMVGFPGFANQPWVEEVSTAEKVRRPAHPFADFLAEAKARKVADYLLLRQDWDPQTQAPEALRGAVVLRAGDQEYTLATTLVAAAGLKGAYIAHTNKPLYLTSHLYAFLQSLGEGQSRSVAVHYVLSSGN